MREISEHFIRSRELLSRLAGDASFLAVVTAIADKITAALQNGNKLLIVGNGGSAADAQHLAAEFVGRFRRDRQPLAAIALTTDTSALTSIANDYGFDQVFERQVRGLARRGDVLLGISTSGRSPNVVRALQAAREMGVVTIGFGGAADMRPLCDLLLEVPSTDTALIQQIHITAGHAICERVEAALFGGQAVQR
jgi:D-sedoheptulose 7-phosphate isomerase